MPIPSESQPAAQTASSQVRAPPSRTGHQRWTNQQTLRFLEMLLEARRDGLLLNSSKGVFVKPVFQYFVPLIEAEFPRRRWGFKILDNKYRHLLQFWRVFREAEQLPGVVYGPANGRLTMSKANEETLRAKHLGVGNRVINKGLLISDAITFDSWAEIFETDPPAGSMMIECDDDAGFAAAAAAERQQRDASTESGDDEGEPRSHDDAYDLFRQRTPRPGASTPSSSTPMPLPLSSPSSRGFTAVRRSSQKGKARQNQQINALIIGLLTDMVARGTQPQQHTIITRAPGAEDFEKAVRDCMRFTRQQGTFSMAKAIIDWLKEDLANPIVWNCLKSPEEKFQWLEGVIMASSHKG